MFGAGAEWCPLEGEGKSDNSTRARRVPTLANALHATWFFPLFGPPLGLSFVLIPMFPIHGDSFGSEIPILLIGSYVMGGSGALTAGMLFTCFAAAAARTLNHGPLSAAIGMLLGALSGLLGMVVEIHAIFHRPFTSNLSDFSIHIIGLIAGAVLGALCIRLFPVGRPS